MSLIYEYNPTNNKYTQTSDTPMKNLTPDQKKIITEILNQGKNLLRSIKKETNFPYILLIFSLSLIFLSLIFSIYIILINKIYFLILLIFPTPVAFSTYMLSKVKRDEIREKRENLSLEWKYGKDRSKVLFKFYDKFSQFNARKCSPVNLKFSFGLSVTQESISEKLMKLENEKVESKKSKSRISTQRTITGKSFYLKFSDKKVPVKGAALNFKTYREALLEQKTKRRRNMGGFARKKRKRVVGNYGGNEILMTKMNIEMIGRDFKEVERHKSMTDRRTAPLEDFGDFYFQGFFEDGDRRPMTPNSKMEYKKYTGGRRDYGIKFTVFRNEQKKLVGGSLKQIFS